MKRYLSLVILLLLLTVPSLAFPGGINLVFIGGGESGYSCTGSLDWGGGDIIESFEYGADDFCSNDWVIDDSGASGNHINTYSTAWSKHLSHSVEIEVNNNNNCNTDGDPACNIGGVLNSDQTDRYFHWWYKAPDVPTDAYSGYIGHINDSDTSNSVCDIHLRDESGVQKLSFDMTSSPSEYFTLTAGNVYYIALRGRRNTANGCELRVWTDTPTQLQTNSSNYILYEDGADYAVRAIYFEDTSNSTTSCYYYVDEVTVSTALIEPPGEAPPSGTPVYESYQYAKGDSTGCTVTKPSGTSSGDLLVAMVASDDGRTHSSDSSEFTVIQQDIHGSSASLSVWYQVAGGSEPSNYSWTFSAAADYVCAIARVTGAAGSPLDVSGKDEAESSTATAPSVTTNQDNSLVFVAISQDTAGVQSVSSWPSVDTQILEEQQDTSAGVLAAFGVFEQASAGATAAKAFSMSSSDNWVSVTAAFKP